MKVIVHTACLLLCIGGLSALVTSDNRPRISIVENDAAAAHAEAPARFTNAALRSGETHRVKQKPVKNILALVLLNLARS